VNNKTNYGYDQKFPPINDRTQNNKIYEKQSEYNRNPIINNYNQSNMNKNNLYDSNLNQRSEPQSKLDDEKYKNYLEYIKQKELYEKEKEREKEREKEKEYDKIKHKHRILNKEKNKKNKLKDKDEESEKKININEKKESKSEIKKDKKEKNFKKSENSNNKTDKIDKNEHDTNKKIKDIQNLLSKIIDNSVTKSNSRGIYPKVDAYTIFKEEYKQYKKGKDEDKSENAMKNEWRKMSKEFKKFYNINAEEQNKLIKEYFNKLKFYKKKKEDEEKTDSNKDKGDKNEKKENI
jgi:hypothetical protein